MKKSGDKKNFKTILIVLSIIVAIVLVFAGVNYLYNLSINGSGGLGQLFTASGSATSSSPPDDPPEEPICEDGGDTGRPTCYCECLAEGKSADICTGCSSAGCYVGEGSECFNQGKSAVDCPPGSGDYICCGCARTSLIRKIGLSGLMEPGYVITGVSVDLKCSSSVTLTLLDEVCDDGSTNGNFDGLGTPTGSGGDLGDVNDPSDPICDTPGGCPTTLSGCDGPISLSSAILNFNDYAGSGRCGPGFGVSTESSSGGCFGNAEVTVTAKKFANCDDGKPHTKTTTVSLGGGIVTGCTGIACCPRTSLTADINGDGCVDAGDLAAVAGSWLANGLNAESCWGGGVDITHNGCVNMGDFSAVSSQWGRCIEC